MMLHSKKGMNWSAKARRISKDLIAGQRLSIAMDDARGVAKELKASSRPALVDHMNRLRSLVWRQRSSDSTRLASLACGGVIEAVRQSMGIELFDVQLHAGLAASLGAVAEMQTGEGKTLALAIPVCVHALSGRGVHVATPNQYLANRDCQLLAPVFELLGVSVGLVSEDDAYESKRHAYDADVTYGPGHAFGFDYLRDQLALEYRDNADLGSHVYAKIKSTLPIRTTLQRGLNAAIVDEIDHVLIDDAVSPLILSQPRSDGGAPDADVHVAALEASKTFRNDADYQFGGDMTISLTSHGFQKAYEAVEWTVHPELMRPWHEYIVLSLRAQHQFQRDVHYVIQGSDAHVVDSSTGRIFASRTWSDGMHQAIEAKEGLPIGGEAVALARITRQRFYRTYNSVSGVTGTAEGCEDELASTYGLPVVQIPLRVPSRRKELPNVVMPDQPGKLKAIAAETREVQQSGRAVLIGTLNIAESFAVSNVLHEQGIEHELLNGLQDAIEADVVSIAGASGSVVVATSMAGRGTDIRLDPVVAAKGGLHVIVTQMHTLSRVDRQLIGRCARCGDPGTNRVYLSAEDALPARYAPWVSRAILRRRDEEDTQVFHRHLKRAQRVQEKEGYAHRWQMLKADRAQEELFSHGVSKSNCDCLVG
ncbi:MAG: preprotein translocase subunit SecA [Rubripirellula sp.]